MVCGYYSVDTVALLNRHNVFVCVMRYQNHAGRLIGAAPVSAIRLRLLASAVVSAEPSRLIHPVKHEIATTECSRRHRRCINEYGAADSVLERFHNIDLGLNISPGGSSFSKRLRIEIGGRTSTASGNRRRTVSGRRDQRVPGLGRNKFRKRYEYCGCWDYRR